MNTEKKTKKKPQYAAPAVDRMLDILEFMAENPQPFGVTELSRRLGISTNLVFRIMKRLTERKYAEVDPDGRYRLSTRFFSLGMSLHSRFELRQRARKHLEWLCDETGETCQIQILNHDKMLVLDTINPPIEFFLQIVPGSRVEINGNAFGKSVLAFMDWEEVKTLLPDPMPRLTEHTITDLDAFAQELEQVRETGLGYDREEYTQGIFCIGAPVFDVSSNAVAGIGVTGLTSRFGEGKRAKFEFDVLTCAATISADIGYTGKFYDNVQKPGK